MPFEPIAIVGRGCVVPGALNPDALWAAIANGQDLTSTVPPGLWPVDPADIVGTESEAIRSGKRATPARGGFVTGFDDVFDPNAFRLPADDVIALDRSVKWLFESGRQAVQDLGRENLAGIKAAVVIGNNAYPTETIGAIAARIFIEDPFLCAENLSDGAARRFWANRFSAGRPAHLLARALAANGPAFCLDAACASSLCAIKLACGYLQDGIADIALAGGLSGTENQFLHLGFGELRALSPTGVSRPFSQRADGLLPAEGAAVLALKRLSDARRNGNRIFAVIRGIGLSNDGRRGGLLTPAGAGQVEALRRAYDTAGIDPKTISLLECHATGTTVGDGVELESTNTVFAEIEDLPMGSLKSNLGHLLTAAGAAAIIKVCGAIESGIRPPTLHVEEPLEAFNGTPLRPLKAAEPWPHEQRRAGISNFGFGGNNAHLILEAHSPALSLHPNVALPCPDAIAVCGVGIIVGEACGYDQFALALLSGSHDALRNPTTQIELPLDDMRIPPNDLKHSLGQQTAAIAACRMASAGIAKVDPQRGGVLIGMGCDVDATRPGLRRWLMAALPRAGYKCSTQEIESMVEIFGGLNGANYVLGSMPNMPANLINVDQNLCGFGYTVASEELSGSTALEIAVHALRANELDMVLAGAVDLSHEEAHLLAAEVVLPEAHRTPADAAVVFALKRRSDAEAAGDPILCTIEIESAKHVEETPSPIESVSEATGLGHAHAASAMVDAAAALVQASTTSPVKPFSAQAGSAKICRTSFTGQSQQIVLNSVKPAPSFGAMVNAPRLFFAAGQTFGELQAAISDRRMSATGRFRVAIAASSEEMMAGRIAAVKQRLASGPAGLKLPGVHFGEDAVAGDVAFMYPGGAAGYRGMGHNLATCFPEEVHSISERSGGAYALQTLSDPLLDLDTADGTGALAGYAMLASTVLRNQLAIEPHAAMGISFGEVAMWIALEAWSEPKSILDEVRAGGFYQQLSGDRTAIAEHLQLPPGQPVEWEHHEIFGPVESVEHAVASIPDVWLTIVSSHRHCTIGGTPSACARVLANVQADKVISSPLGITMHGVFASSVADRYRQAHCRPPAAIGPIRFYSNSRHDVVPQDADAIADSLTHQLVNPVNFPPTLEKAWDDGVRIFVDVGPRNVLSHAVSATLGARQHTVITLDNPKRSGLLQLAEAAAALFAAGIDVDLAALSNRFSRLRGERIAPVRTSTERVIAVEAHLPPIQKHILEAYRKDFHRMPPDNSDQKPTIMPQPPDLPPPAGRRRPAAKGEACAHVPEAAAPAPAPIHRVDTGSQAAQPTAEQEVSEVNPSMSAMSTGVATLELDRSTPQTAFPSSPSGPGPQRTNFHASPEPIEPLPVLPPEGPAFDRRQIEILASGKVSEVFGAAFARQDEYQRQCRMPEPPLLLANRVLGISGEPGSMGKGICWTETDITDDAWYLHNQTMPTGLMIESGQADLLLISWLGVDFLNQNERVYRLLGCEITFHESTAPTVGDTLRFQIHIDGHATLGDTRMFFFRYDARIGDRLVSSVRSGQAGFFTDAELAGSGGVLWSAESDQPKTEARLDPPPCPSKKRSFSAEEVAAFAAGDAFACFGAELVRAAAHQRTPAIPSGRMQLIDRIAAFDPSGGPWGRGYLLAENDVPTDAWFYDGHFKNDPCMPGTLMAEAATQALAFYMAALGLTVDRDGWVFRPVTGEAFKFVCRGQVVPDRPHVVTYELHIEEVVIDDDAPAVYAAMLARCDGHKVFLCRRMGLKLVRDWPLYGRSTRSSESADRRIVSPSGDVPGDYGALMACAWGKPSDGFGSMYSRFDRESSLPRLPGPPYHFMSRIVSVTCEPGVVTPGGTTVVEYDVSPDDWYFRDGGNGKMPFSVLTEVLLQPCGWLALYMGFALGGGLKFRNLDGIDVVIDGEVTPETGTLTIETTFTKSAIVGPMSIVSYDIVCRSAEQSIMRLKTNFGFFPAEALAAQKGLPVSDEQRNALSAQSIVGTTSAIPDPLANDICAGMPTGRLAMVDDVTGFWPDGGKAGLGRATGCQTIDPTAWYFKAHFYQDPVQPGSLGLEALFNLLKAAIKLKGLHQRFSSPRFEAPGVGRTLGWKYRGQVIPTNRQVVTEIEIVEIIDEGDTLLVTGEGSLWVDGLRIYEVQGYALRIRERDQVTGNLDSESRRSLGRPAVDLSGWTIDANVDPWLDDHCPTYCLPVYPMMGVVADLLNGEQREPVKALAEVELNAWIKLDQGPVSLTSKAFSMTDGRISRQIYQLVDGTEKRIGRAVEIEANDFPPAPSPWPDVNEDAALVDDLYSNGDLVHFGTFQLARDFYRTASRSRFVFDAGEAVRRANGHAGILLDVLLHGSPRNRPWLWYGDAAKDHAVVPYRLESLQLYSSLPSAGELEVISRADTMPTPRTTRTRIQVRRSGTVVMELSLIDALVPIGAGDKVAPADRRALGLGTRYVPNWALAEVAENSTTVTVESVRQANWLPGTVETIYGLGSGAMDERALTELVAIKDHFACRHRLHPSAISVTENEVKVGPLGRVPTSVLRMQWIGDSTFRIEGSGTLEPAENRHDDA